MSFNNSSRVVKFLYGSNKTTSEEVSPFTTDYGNLKAVDTDIQADFFPAWPYGWFQPLNKLAEGYSPNNRTGRAVSLDHIDLELVFSMDRPTASGVVTAQDSLRVVVMYIRNPVKYPVRVIGGGGTGFTRVTCPREMIWDRFFLLKEFDGSTTINNPNSFLAPLNYDLRDEVLLLADFTVNPWFSFVGLTGNGGGIVSNFGNWVDTVKMSIDLRGLSSQYGFWGADAGFTTSIYTPYLVPPPAIFRPLSASYDDPVGGALYIGAARGTNLGVDPESTFVNFFGTSRLFFSDN